MRYHFVSQLSANRKKTPEGYLVCLGVPVARTGVLEYLPEEVPEDILPDLGPDAEDAPDVIRVSRSEADVFAPATMASYEGKPVTIDHPDGFVTPENWRELACGHAQNVRRGAGEESDLLLADLVITEQEAIELVESGELREVSCGYDADYEPVAPDNDAGKAGVRGRQHNIIGNHVALVPHGRCGSRCAIKDGTMSKTTKPGFLDRLFGNPKVRRVMDEALAEEATKETAKDNDIPPAGKKEGEQATDNGNAVAQLAAKVEELTLLVRSLVEAGGSAGGKAGDNNPEAVTGNGDGEPDGATGDGDDDQGATGDGEPDGGEPDTTKSTGDRARMADAETVRRANVLAPGLRARTGDSAQALKRAALRQAMRDADMDRVIRAVLRGMSVDAAPRHMLDAAFAAAAEVAGNRNNRRTADSFTRASTRDFGKAVTPADINRMNREYHDKAGSEHGRVS